MGAPAFCPYCGARALAADQVFCGSCGRSFAGVAADPPIDLFAVHRAGVAAAPSGQTAAHDGALVPGPAAGSGGSEAARPAAVQDASPGEFAVAVGERVRTLTGAQWMLIAGIGQAIAAALPWIQTSLAGASRGPLTGVGTHPVLLVALLAAIAAAASSAVMAFDAGRAQQKLWRNWYLIACVATLACAGLVFLSFAGTQTYGLASPGIGLFLAVASGVTGIVAVVRFPVR